MHILKFGGTSVGSVESIRQVIRIVDAHRQKDNAITVVLSAMSGVTNQLIGSTT